MATAWQVVFCRDARGHAPVERLIERLPAKLQARVLRSIDLLSEHGIALTAPLAEKVAGERFWELRIQQASNSFASSTSRPLAAVWCSCMAL